MNCIQKTLFLSIALLCFGFGPFSSSVWAKDDLVAKVGQVPITAPEVMRESEKVLPRSAGFHGSLSEERLQAARQKALDNLIERAYMVQHSLDEQIKIDKKEFDQAYHSIRDKFKSNDEFKKALGSESPDQFQEALRRELLAKKAQEKAVEEKIRVTPVEVLSAYEENRNMYTRPKSFRASLILINVDPAALPEKKEALQKKAEDVAAKAKKGEDYFNLAYYNSDDRTRFVGGDIGYMHQGQLIPELEEHLLKMTVGEVKGPISTDYGYTIIKLTESQEARQLAFEEVQDNIRKRIEDERRKALFDTWMQALKLKYPVRHFDKD